MLFQNIHIHLTNLVTRFWPSIAFSLLILYCLRARYQKGLNKYDGPFLASFTNFWRLWQALWHWDRVIYPDLLKYGKVIRVGPNTLLFSEPDAIKDIYSSGFGKSNQYRVAAGVSRGAVVTNLFTSTDKKWHSNLRRAVSNAFALSTLIQYEPLVTRTITTFLRVTDQRFAGKPDPTGMVDFAHWTKYFALDVISELAFGRPYGVLQAGTDRMGIIKTRTGFIRYFSVVSNASWIDDLIYKNPILIWLGRRGWFDQATLTVPLARKQLAERLKQQHQDEEKEESSYKGPVDLLTKFFQAKQDSPETVDDRAVLGLTLSMVNAGSGTIATTLIALFYYVLKTPEKMSRLRTELDSHFPPPDASASIQSFEEYVVPFGPAQKLPYLDACIKETLRIHPALGAQLMEQVVPPEGATIAGEFVPGGTIVSSNAWIVQRHKPTYGEDVDAYRPERWLECDSQQVSAMNRALLTWGAGPHTCIGKNIGLLELYKVVPSILRMFTVEAVDPEATLKIYNIGEAEPYDFYVRLNPRYGRVVSKER